MNISECAVPQLLPSMKHNTSDADAHTLLLSYAHRLIACPLPLQITTYKVHKVDHSGSAHSSLDDHASRAMSGLSLSGLGGSRVALNPLCDSEGLETLRALAAFADASPKAFGDGVAFPLRRDSADDELTLDFTETGSCILRGATPVRPLLSSDSQLV